MSTIEKALRKAQPADGGAAQERPATPLGAERPPQSEAPIDGNYQTLDRQQLQRLGLLVPEQDRSQLAEEFRLIKRPILNNAFGRQSERIRAANLVMVTSSLPREGKSFCTINLALSIAREVDRTVLLVDADVARPAIPAYLGLNADVGLLDVLNDPTRDLSEVILRTDIPNLSIVPAGRSHGHSTELLASEDMARLAAEMAERYSDRIVLFDSPPLLATTEASVLASHMGQVVLVVEAERAGENEVRRSLELLKSCDVVMTLLNKTRRIAGMDYGYGYYGYGYGGYGA